MENEKFFMNCSTFGIEISSSDLNSASEQLHNSIFNPNWDNSMDQSDPFESALSSIVSSPAASTGAAGAITGDNLMIRELLGRLGSISVSGEISISPESCVDPNNINSTTNTSCYNTPLNSPPKLNLSSMADSQIGENFQIPGSHFPFPADPGFAERAARLSCFGRLGSNETEVSYRSMPKIESGKLSRVSSNQSFKLSGAGSQIGIQEINTKSSPQDVNSIPDKKVNMFLRCSTPENAEFGNSREGSSVSDQIPFGQLSIKTEGASNSRKRKSVPRGKVKETPSSSQSAKDAKDAAENNESNPKRSKPDEVSGKEKEKDNNNNAEAESNASKDLNQKLTKDDSKPPEPPKDYIHVRARRGQATDSHSLAERVRREKISERMKFLQDLVPGCNKVIGKAVMLDEIINYVQSLQRQVEFLSMKLATINPRMDVNMEAVLPKDIFQSRGSLPHTLANAFDSSMPAFPNNYHPLQPPLHNGFSTGTESQCPETVNSLTNALRGNLSMQVPHVNSYGEANPQVSTFWEDDLQSVVQMGYGQN